MKGRIQHDGSQDSNVIKQKQLNTLIFNYQLLDKVEQNIVICPWRADQLFANAVGRGKSLICEPPTNHDILREPSSIIVLSFTYKASF